MHRTISLDYIAVMSGEIVLRLDGGEEKIVKAGEYIVQKGVNHQWINRTQEQCRIMVVMVGAEKITLEDGTTLEETVIPKPSGAS
jgi:quercetin dioxygenase-like cupin family protein